MMKFVLGMLFGVVVGVCVGRDDVRNFVLGQATARSAMAAQAVHEAVTSK